MYSHGDRRILSSGAAKADSVFEIGLITTIRSTAGDVLTYLDAQLHPDRLPP